MLRNHLLPLAILLLLCCTACHDDDDASQQPDDGNEAPAACIISGESTNYPGNEASWAFHYDAQHMFAETERLNGLGMQAGKTTVSEQNTVVTRTIDQASVITRYDVNIFEALPTRAQSTVVISPGDTSSNYYTYHFSYDTEQRLTRVSESTETVANDYEWELAIAYDEQDNVSELQYSFSTGPSDTSFVRVMAYDEHPTPYAGVPAWKFIQNNFSWDSADPEPLLTALSAHNPLDYTINGGTATATTRSMQYQYNEEGFPSLRQNATVHPNGQANSFTQTFVYSCQ